ncbi:MAG: dihydrolipoyl dehydrogenase [Clostridia bacterium]|nr:dihydrolipoyl dehydrogenase [Clostridia bacterium]MBQ3068599.1 dihydrolipoyl dehydrogenase [Clostridia bacterium]
MDKFDLIVLGGGPAGYLAGERAGHAGLKTLVIEERALGGTCLNEGCIPSKALLYSAKIFDYTRHGDKYGVTCSSSSIDQEKVIARKNKVVKTLVGGIGMQLKANGVTVVNKRGMILGKKPDGFHVEADGVEYVATNLIISTGSTAVVPPIPGLKEAVEAGFAVTNREILDLTVIPKEFVVIGGGVIGLEMASYFSSVGSHVTVIEMLDKIAGPTDKEISKILQKNYEAKGIEFKLSCKVTSFGKDFVEYEEKGEKKTVKADKVLLSIGRRPNTQGIGLENLHVEMDRAAIKTDEKMRTNISGLYATGDVNGKSMLAHTAYRESEVAINNILGKKDTMRYNAIPAAIYTNPEVATVGETIDSAKAKGINAKEINITMNYSGRYVAENEGGNGICKLVVDQDNNRLVGVHMITNYASEIIYGAAMMVEAEMKIDDIKEFVFPHPSVAEIIREALFMI